MAIKRIKVSNFKSFKEIDLELGAFSVLIGANASGKSNFIQIFGFLRDLAIHGLEDAVSLQGGTEYLRNMPIGVSRPLVLEVVFDAMGTDVFHLKNRDWRLGAAWREAAYRLGLSSKRKGAALDVAEERLVLPAEFFHLERTEARGDVLLEETEKLGDGSIEHSIANGHVRTAVRLSPDVSAETGEVEVPSRVWLGQKVPRRGVRLLEVPGASGIQAFRDIAIYDFDPKLPKKAVPIAGKSELEEDASNLALALRAVTRNKERRRQFANLVRDLLPFVRNVRVEEFSDKSMLLKLRETFFGGKYLPASMVSDGTINIAALVLALYFQRKPVVVVEEPERNVHPHLLCRLVTLMKEASQKRQIIVTTHNPGIVRHAGLDSILLVSRDKEGFSRISRPVEKAEVQTFLKNEIGIDELFAQSVLESLA